MASDQVEDAALLTDLTEFLLGYDALQLPPELQIQSATTSDTKDLLHDSNQLLMETEALLASVEVPDSVSPTITSVPTLTANSALKPHKTAAELRREVQNAQAAKRRLKYRSKLKNERQTLREQEQTLSEHLSHLQRMRKRAKSLRLQNATISEWKDIATRQIQGRLEAEEQQRRLKNAVALRSQVISEVKEMMWQPLNAQFIYVGNTIHEQLDAEDKALFEDYLQDLDVVYRRTDEVLETCGAHEDPVMSYRIGPERKRDGHMEFIDNLDVLFVPFTFEQTCSALWKSMVHVHQQEGRQHYGGIIDQGNTIAVKFHLRCPSETGKPVELMVHFVMRRYLEAERMVLVWRALSEGQGKFTGMHSDETGWCLVYPNDMYGDCDDPLMRTVMQTYVRFIPLNITNKLSSEERSDQFVSLVVSSIDEDAEEIARMMDSLVN